ncbi:MAG: DUF2341 domain-containing protein, partial [Methanopyri archaeon]|nr:DUF2341 domain-containing protein [Methanopyri archaeon]
MKLHIYHGNNDVSSVSDGPSVFALFDDFEDGNTDGWAASQTLKDASGETYQVTATSDSAGAGTYSLFIDTHASCYATPCCGIYALASRDVGLPDGTYVVDLLRRAWGQRWGYCGKGGGAWVPRSFVRHGDADIFSTTATYTSNECGSGDINWGEVTTDPFDVTGGTAIIRLVTYSWDCEDGRGWFDDVRVRKSVDPAPAVTSGDEESLEPESSDWIPSKAPFDENVVNSETSGGFGKALDFNGADESVSIPDQAALRIVPPITVEAWIKADTWATETYQGIIVDKHHWQGIGGYGGYVLRTGGAGKLNFNFGACIGSWPSAMSTVSMEKDRWYHVAGTHDGSTIRLYIDGQDAGSTSTSKSICKTNIPLTIGRGSFWNDRLFDGTIDEVRIWKTALSKATIQEWMSKAVDGEHPDYTNLVAYYQFDEGTGTAVTDSAGGDQDGSLKNMGDTNRVVSTIPVDEGEGNTAADLAGGDNDGTLMNMEGGPVLVEVAADVCGDGQRGFAFRDRNLDGINDELCSQSTNGCWCTGPDCCCCYVLYHDHDLGALFKPEMIVVQFASNFQEPGKSAEVSVSTDGHEWTLIGETNPGWKGSPRNTTFNVKGKSFRFVRVKATQGYNDDWSGVWVYESERHGPFDLAFGRAGDTLDTPSISCGSLPCRYIFKPGAGNLQVATDQELNITLRKLGTFERIIKPAAQDIIASAEEDQIAVIENLIAILGDAPEGLGIGQELREIGREASEVLNQSIDVAFANEALYSVGLDLNITGLTNETLEALVNGTWLALQLDIEGSQEVISDAASLSDHADRTIRTQENVRTIAEQALVKVILERASASKVGRLALVLGARKLVVDIYASVLGFEATAELVAKLNLAIEELKKPEPDEAIVEDALQFVRENLPEVEYLGSSAIPNLELGRGELAASARVAGGLSSGMSTIVEEMRGLIEGTTVNASVDTYLVNGEQVSVFTMSI